MTLTQDNGRSPRWATRLMTVDVPAGQRRTLDVPILSPDADIALQGHGYGPQTVVHDKGLFFWAEDRYSPTVNGDVIKVPVMAPYLSGPLSDTIADRTALWNDMVVIRIPEPRWLVKIVDSGSRITVRPNARLNVDVEPSISSSLDFEGHPISPAGTPVCVFPIGRYRNASAMAAAVAGVIPYGKYYERQWMIQPDIRRPDVFSDRGLEDSVSLMEEAFVSTLHTTLPYLSRGALEGWLAARKAALVGPSRAGCFEICDAARKLVPELEELCRTRDMTVLPTFKRALIAAQLLTIRADFEPDRPTPAIQVDDETIGIFP